MLSAESSRNCCGVSAAAVAPPQQLGKGKLTDLADQHQGSWLLCWESQLGEMGGAAFSNPSPGLLVHGDQSSSSASGCLPPEEQVAGTAGRMEEAGIVVTSGGSQVFLNRDLNLIMNFFVI